MNTALTSGLVALALVTAVSGTAVADSTEYTTSSNDPAFHTDGMVYCFNDADVPYVQIAEPNIDALPGGDETVWWTAFVYEVSAGNTGWLPWNQQWFNYLTTPTGRPSDSIIVAPAFTTYQPPARAAGGLYYVLFEYYWAPRSAGDSWVGPVYEWAGQPGVASNYLLAGFLFSPSPSLSCDFRTYDITVTSPF